MDNGAEIEIAYSKSKNVNMILGFLIFNGQIDVTGSTATYQ